VHPQQHPRIGGVRLVAVRETRLDPDQLPGADPVLPVALPASSAVSRGMRSATPDIYTVLASVAVWPAIRTR